jgi:CheY-like chemotaxis protein
MQQPSKNILLIDDDEVNNFLSHEIISLHNPNVVITSLLFVKDALIYLQDIVERKLPLPDIILVDINMPWLNGWDFIEAFEKMNIPGAEKIKLYVYTSSTYYKDIDKAKSYPSVLDILTKPLTDDVLRQIMN